jgi:pimeloyl-ACP methyl ester carboxylesterase
MTRKILIVCLSLILIFAVFIFAAVFATGPSLPDVTDSIIEDVINSEPADELPGETGYADTSGFRIWYKTVEPAGVSKGDILLVTGIAADSLWWPPCFVKELTESGYRVILFDNRSTGMSDWMEGYPHWRYTFSEMSADGISVLDKLKIGEAHIIGVSMGGMIAQQMAILYPGRVKSLISIMSSANLSDTELPHVPWKTVWNVVRISCRYGIIKSEKNIIKLHLGIWQLFRNEELSSADIKSVSGRVFFNMRKRRAYNPLALPQQLHAIISSGSRYDGLKKVSKPALFIHGKNDPLILYPHGVKCSQLVNGASLMLVNGMGHDIPCAHSSSIAQRITDFISGKKF